MLYQNYLLEQRTVEPGGISFSEEAHFGGSSESNCVSMFEPREIFLFIFK